MKLFDMKADSLEEYYRQFKELSDGAYEEDYLLYLDKLQELAMECDSYKELGVMQGVSAAAVCLANPKIEMTLIDIDLSRFRKYEHLFPDTVIAFETDSRIAPRSPCDLLFIDSAHTPHVISRELARHGHLVNKFIMAHDTAARPKMRPVLESFAGGRSITHDNRSCGFTIIDMRHA